MRSAGNFHPEWGYLAPAPSFLRTARVAIVATAIGATAGAVVVVSLLARPGSNDDNSSIAAHALVTSAPVITSPGSPPAKVATVELAKTKQSAATLPAPLPPPATPDVASASSPAAPSATAAKNVASASTTQTAAPSALGAGAASAETPPAIATAESTPVQPDGAAVSADLPGKKVVSKRRRSARYEAARRWDARRRWRENSGFAPLLRLFSFRTGWASSPN